MSIRILLLQTGGPEKAIRMMAGVSELKRRFPHISLTLAAHSDIEVLFRSHSHIDHFVVIHKNIFQIVRKIRGLKLDILCSWNSSWENLLLTVLSGIPWCLGIRKGFLDILVYESLALDSLPQAENSSKSVAEALPAKKKIPQSKDSQVKPSQVKPSKKRLREQSKPSLDQILPERPRDQSRKARIILQGRGKGEELLKFLDSLLSQESSSSKRKLRLPKLPDSVQKQSKERVSFLLSSLGIHLERVSSGIEGVAPIVICPASASSSKCWPSWHFAILIGKIVTHLKKDVILLSTHQEKAAEQIIRFMEIFQPLSSRKRVHDLTGKVSIGEMYDLICRSSAFIGNDSFPAALAEAANKPSIVIFGPTFPDPNASYRSVDLHLDCRPCSSRTYTKCPLLHFRCMKEIQPEEVMNHLNDLLLR